MSRAPSLVLACLVLAGIASPALARGEWYDHYEQGLRALEDGRYEQAVDSLQRAMQRKKRSGYFRTYGNNYLRYVPHFHLGVAYHGMGDCERALASFTRSEDENETAPEPALAARLRSLRQACEERLAPAPPEPTLTAAADPAPPPASLVEQEPEPEPEPRAPPVVIDAAGLERGLRAYLAGDLEAAEQAFGDLARGSPGSADVHLLLGMTLHGRWAAGGEADAELLRRSRRALAEAVRLDPGLVPDPALCPPRVVALVRSLR